MTVASNPLCWCFHMRGGEVNRGRRVSVGDLPTCVVVERHPEKVKVRVCRFPSAIEHYSLTIVADNSAAKADVFPRSAAYRARKVDSRSIHANRGLVELL